ncbi:MAG: lysophospholipase [Erysipelotrichaceae bacterium]|nr:lysophospholipase [Erysipelotrichaceae bacterium]MBR2745411.1 lysophospholipase [Erysipelotrichaceae bacterium]
MIQKKKIEFVSTIDGLKLFANIYIPDNPKAIIHVMHGMSEHKERYDEFCNILARLNCVVVIMDHRGHGESISDRIPLGYFADKDGWMTNLKDLNALAKKIMEQYRHLPYFVIGHSMGSLFATSYLKRFEDMISGVIFSGMPAWNKQIPMGRKLAAAMCKINGPKNHSKTLAKTASPFNSAIKNPRTEFDWLSYNVDNVDKYIEDPLCGFPFTNQGYCDLMDGMIDVFSNKDWRVLKKNLPILFVSGQDDPCSNVPEGFKYSLDNLAKAGYTNIEANVYENMRHEILNERERKIVYKDILSWLDIQIKALDESEQN